MAQPLERVLQRGMGEPTTCQRLGLGLEGRGVEQPLDEPCHGAADPALDRGRRPHPRAELGAHALVVQPAGRRHRLARQRAQRPIHSAQRAPLALALQAFVEQVADVVHEQRP